MFKRLFQQHTVGNVGSWVRSTRYFRESFQESCDSGVGLGEGLREEVISGGALEM